MDKSELARLINRLKSGTATAREKEILESYWQSALKDDSGLDGVSPHAQENLKKEMFVAITNQVGFNKRQKVISIFKFDRSLYKIAAAILVLFICSAVWYLNVTIKTDLPTETALAEIHTNYGQRLTIKLPDESSVVLNGNSTIRYSKNWSESEPREVWIDGEGFFAVQHTKNNQKFIVHIREGLNVEVLGTKFNVKSREHGSEVLLTEGKVQLNVSNETDHPVILQPGELATMKKNKLSKRAVEDKQYTSWIRSKLFFDKMTLEELALILHDTYGLQVTFENEELKYRQLSGEISSASIEDILFAIAETFNIEVIRKNANTVTFSSNTN
ncbi:MAG TPA: FecR domain-containing protein [Chryseolinea sp.]|nr:FecR domain-containing protein [Chryseolinea sp.]